MKITRILVYIGPTYFTDLDVLDRTDVMTEIERQSLHDQVLVEINNLGIPLIRIASSVEEVNPRTLRYF